MKASRFVKPFADSVDIWERTLSLILEVTEMLLTVQRLWMYMEVSLILIAGCYLSLLIVNQVMNYEIDFLRLYHKIYSMSMTPILT